MTPLPCPHCKGRGKLTVAMSQLVIGLERCPVCEGHRHISREYARRICDGKAMKRERLERGLSIREAAEERGVSPVELSKMERGKG